MTNSVRGYRWKDLYPGYMSAAPEPVTPVGTDTCRYCGQLINSPYCSHCGAPRLLALRESAGKVEFESHDDTPNTYQWARSMGVPDTWEDTFRQRFNSVPSSVSELENWALVCGLKL